MSEIIKVDDDFHKTCKVHHCIEEPLVFENDDNTNEAERLLSTCVIPKHKIVTDRKGRRVHRLYNIALSRANGEELFKRACRAALTLFAKKLCEHPVYKSLGCYYVPNMAFSLGGAGPITREMRRYSETLWSVGKSDFRPFRYYNLIRRVDSEGKLVSFELSDYNKDDNIPFDQVYAIIVDDAANTLLSIELAKKYIESLGVKILGAIVLFNQYGDVWDDLGIPINIAYARIDQEKYYDDTCPVCKKLKPA